MSGIDAGVLTSADPMCNVKGGTSFWVLHLTKDLIDQLNKQQQQSIRAIEDNTPFELFGAPISPVRTRRDKSPKILLAEERDRYIKRDTVTKQVVDDVKVL